MARSSWPDGKVSVILLPSGAQGEAVLDVAREWTRMSLLSPALWVRPENVRRARTGPPRILASVIALDRQHQVTEVEVDLFESLARESLSLVRLVKLRSAAPSREIDAEQDDIADHVGEYLTKAMPLAVPTASTADQATDLSRLTLICAPTEFQLQQRVDWAASEYGTVVVASPEDRASPWSGDAFVRDNERFVGFALMHLASVAGLWNGVSEGTFELIPREASAHQSVWVSRVFLNAVITEALSRRTAAQVLDLASQPDSLLIDPSTGLPPAGTAFIDDELVPTYVSQLVDASMMLDNQALSFHATPSASHLERRRITIMSQLRSFTSFSFDKLIVMPKWTWRWITSRTGRALTKRLQSEDGMHVVGPDYDSVLDARDAQLRAQRDEILANEQAARAAAAAPVGMSMLRTTPTLWSRLRELVFGSLDGSADLSDLGFTPIEDKAPIFGRVTDVFPSPDHTWTLDDGPAGFPQPLDWFALSKGDPRGSLLIWTNEAAHASDQAREIADAAEQEFAIMAVPAASVLDGGAVVVEAGGSDASGASGEGAGAALSADGEAGDAGAGDAEPDDAEADADGGHEIAEHASSSDEPDDESADSDSTEDTDDSDDADDTADDASDDDDQPMTRAEARAARAASAASVPAHLAPLADAEPASDEVGYLAPLGASAVAEPAASARPSAVTQPSAADDALRADWEQARERRDRAAEAFAASDAERQRRADALASFDEWAANRDRSFAWQLLGRMAVERKAATDAAVRYSREIEHVKVPAPGELLRLRKAFHKRMLVTFVITAAVAAFIILLPIVVPDLRTGLDALGWWYPQPWQTLVLAAVVYVILTSVYLAGYHRGWSAFQRSVTITRAHLEHVSEASRNARRESARLTSLHRQAIEWLDLLARAVHQPWRVRPEWQAKPDYSIARETMPFAMSVGTVAESNIAAATRLRRLTTEHLVRKGWRAAAFRDLVREIGTELGQPSESFGVTALDEDLPHASNHTRQMLRDNMRNPDVLTRVAIPRLRGLVAEIQQNALHGSKPRVVPIDDNPLDAVAAMSNPIEVDTSVAWDDFLLGSLASRRDPVTPLSTSWLATHQVQEGHHEQVTSYLVLPERLDRELDFPSSSRVVTAPFREPERARIDVVWRSDIVGPLPIRAIGLWDNAPAVQVEIDPGQYNAGV